eukprot:Hpha_TRINITY_DN35608_c0_g1::TRINITY_DN35608_c0_g1_i1::g.68537::m.68537
MPLAAAARGVRWAAARSSTAVAQGVRSPETRMWHEPPSVDDATPPRRRKPEAGELRKAVEGLLRREAVAAAQQRADREAAVGMAHEVERQSETLANIFSGQEDLARRVEAVEQALVSIVGQLRDRAGVSRGSPLAAGPHGQGSPSPGPGSQLPVGQLRDRVGVSRGSPPAAGPHGHGPTGARAVRDDSPPFALRRPSAPRSSSRTPTPSEPPAPAPPPPERAPLPHVDAGVHTHTDMADAVRAGSVSTETQPAAPPPSALAALELSRVLLDPPAAALRAPAAPLQAAVAAPLPPQDLSPRYSPSPAGPYHSHFEGTRPGATPSLERPQPRGESASRPTPGPRPVAPTPASWEAPSASTTESPRPAAAAVGDSPSRPTPGPRPSAPRGVPVSAAPATEGHRRWIGRDALGASTPPPPARPAATVSPTTLPPQGPERFASLQQLYDELGGDTAGNTPPLTPLSVSPSQVSPSPAGLAVQPNSVSLVDTRGPSPPPPLSRERSPPGARKVDSRGVSPRRPFPARRLTPAPLF